MSPEVKNSPEDLIRSVIDALQTKTDQLDEKADRWRTMNGVDSSDLAHFYAIGMRYERLATLGRDLIGQLETFLDQYRKAGVYF